MSVRRVEITVSEETWGRLNAVRGHEPRASFVKRALESALSGGGSHSRGDEQAPSADASAEVPSAPSRASAELRWEDVPQFGPDGAPLNRAARVAPERVPGVVPARTLVRDGVAMERQARLNKARKS